MSEGPARSSTAESSSAASSGLDFEDTALTLTLRLPGSDPDVRKRAASTSDPAARGRGSSSPRASEAPPAPKYVRPLARDLRSYARGRFLP